MTTAADQVEQAPHPVPVPRADPKPLVSREKVVLGVFAALAIAVPLTYASITNHVWEDYLITFRHSRNLVDGKGLLYQPGMPPLHGFTSPIGVLLPALCYAITGGESIYPSLWLFRACCIVAFAGGIVLLMLSMRRASPGTSLPVLAVGLLYLAEPRAVVYTTNGMETAFMLLFLSWALYLYTQNQANHWLALGLCWAGLMWIRPDSPIYIATTSFAALVYARDDRRRTFLALFKSAAVCTVLYLPWFIGAWVYYGTPVPHTIMAKSFFEQNNWNSLTRALIAFPTKYFRTTGSVFLPIGDGTVDPDAWDAVLKVFVLTLGVIAASYWLFTLKDRDGHVLDDWLGRYASLCFALVCLYLSFLPILFAWYTPPAALLALVALVRGVFTVVRARWPSAAAAGWWTAPRLAFAILLALFVERTVTLGLTTEQMRVQQKEIETNHRAAIGRYLKAHARPGDRVFLEPLGYIGYYSELHMLDYPGLVAPEVVAARRLHKDEIAAAPSPIEAGFVAAALELKPEWIVVREHELLWLEKRPEFRQQYQLDKTFNASTKLDEYGYIPLRSYLQYDAFFHVFHRKTPEASAG